MDGVSSGLSPRGLEQAREVAEGSEQRQPSPDRFERVAAFSNYMSKVFGAGPYEKLVNSCKLLLGKNQVCPGGPVPPYAGQDKVSSGACQLFEAYVRGQISMPSVSALSPSTRQELWQLCWAFGDIHAMGHFYTWEEINHPDFGQVMAPVLTWNSLGDQEGYALILLSALATAYDRKLGLVDRTIIGQGFLTFLQTHDSVLGPCFDILWKEACKGTDICIERADFSLVRLTEYRRSDGWTVCNVLSYQAAKTRWSPDNFLEFLRPLQLKPSGEINRVQMRWLSSTPDKLDAQLTELAATELTEQDVKALAVLSKMCGHFHWDTLGFLLQFPAEELQGAFNWMDKLGLDHLVTHQQRWRVSFGSSVLTDDNKASVRVLIDRLKPTTISLSYSPEWLRLFEGLRVVQIKASLWRDVSVSQPPAPYKEVESLEIVSNYRGEGSVSIPSAVVPSLKELVLDHRLRLDGTLPDTVTTLVLSGLPQMRGVVPPLPRSLANQAHVETLVLPGDHCYPVDKPAEGYQHGEEFFGVIAKMPSLKTLQLTLSNWINLDNLRHLADSKSLTQLHVNYRDITRDAPMSEEEVIGLIQPIVGPHIKVSLWKDTFSGTNRYLKEK